MTPRSMRRAQERKARKENDRKARKENDRKARKEEIRKDRNTEIAQSQPGQIEMEPEENCMPITSQPYTSEKQQAANRLNAIRSTGPKTAAGKKTVSVNAVKTGLTGQTVLLSSDSAEEYATHIQRFIQLHNPVGAEEQILVQSIADTEWRLMRIPRLEFAIYAQGHQQFAPQVADLDPQQQAGFIEYRTWIHFEKQLSNLMRQEARLRRNREKDEAALRKLQSSRAHLERVAKESRATQAHAPTPVPQTVIYVPIEEENGFELSSGDCEPEACHETHQLHLETAA